MRLKRECGGGRQVAVRWALRYTKREKFFDYSLHPVGAAGQQSASVSPRCSGPLGQRTLPIGKFRKVQMFLGLGITSQTHMVPETNDAPFRPAPCSTLSPPRLRRGYACYSPSRWTSGNWHVTEPLHLRFWIPGLRSPFCPRRTAVFGPGFGRVRR